MVVYQRRGVVLLLLFTVSLGLSTHFSAAVDTESQPVAANPTSEDGSPTEAEEHGLSAKAVEIARPFNFPITNSMVVSWIVAVGLIVFAQFATRNMKQVPSGAQNFLEWLVEALYQFHGGNHRPAFGGANVLVFCDYFHLYSLRQLGRPYSRRWLDRLGASDRSRLQN